MSAARPAVGDVIRVRFAGLGARVNGTDYLMLGMLDVYDPELGPYTCECCGVRLHRRNY